jgi:hypothetical protein
MAGNIGGRQSFSFYDPILQEAPKEVAFKNLYQAMDMLGVTMSGRHLTAHFVVLPTDAQVEKQGLDGVNFIQDMKAVLFDQKRMPKQQQR